MYANVLPGAKLMAVIKEEAVGTEDSFPAVYLRDFHGKEWYSFSAES